MKNRDVTFDIMKGIGILLMITCHFFGRNHIYLGRSISSFHMPMFFMVAGYFSKSYTSWEAARESIKRYFSRLLFPFIFAQLLLVIWDMIIAFSDKSGWDLMVRDGLSLFWADVYGPNTSWGNLTIGVIWFLCALFVSKTLLLVLVSRLKNWAIPVSFVFALGSILVHKVFPYSIWCVSLGFTALPFVTIGWWLKDHKIPLWLQMLFIAAWLLAIRKSELDMYCFTWKHYPLDVIGALGGTFTLFYLSKWIAKCLKTVGRAFAYLGVISLAIMCVHYFELASNLGNRIWALVGINLPKWGLYIWRYVLTLGLAVVMVHVPKVKKLFV